MRNLYNFEKWILESEERDDFYKSELNPKFWKENQFDPSIRGKLLKISQDFSEALKITAPIKDIQLTGSLANYTWNKKSDLDVHVLIQFSDIDDNEGLVKKALDGARFIWNLRHKINLRGHDVELYIQDINEPHVASGLFSLLKNEWIRVPRYNPPEIDYRDVDKKFHGIVNEIIQMQALVDSSDYSNISQAEIYNYAVKLKKKIIEMRKEGLASGGEFSLENLVFKKLRNEGYIEKIIEIVSKAYINIYNE